jgi:hypothetical protein
MRGAPADSKRGIERSGRQKASWDAAVCGYGASRDLPFADGLLK